MAEVGNPTIVATLTVVAALLPMLFVSGLMGPYMSPIPANASAAMIFSFFVAVMITPWLMLKIAGRAPAHARHDGHDHGGALGRAYAAVARPILRHQGAQLVFLLVVGVLSFGSLALFYTKDVTVKLLPFDNKSELSVVIDLPEGASVEATDARRAGRRRAWCWTCPRSSPSRPMPAPPRRSTSTGWCATTTCAPMPEHGRRADQPRRQRTTATAPAMTSRWTCASGSRRIDRARRAPRESGRAAARPAGDRDAAGRGLWPRRRHPPRSRRQGPRRLRARALHRRCRRQLTAPSRARLRADRLDRRRSNSSGSQERDVFDTLAMLNGGDDGRLFASRRGPPPDPDPDRARRAATGRWTSASCPPRSRPTSCPGDRGVVELGDVVQFSEERASFPIFRHNGRAAEMVTGELAGAFEAPLYGMLAVARRARRDGLGPGCKSRRSAARPAGG